MIKKEIQQICREYNINNYYINDDMSVNVNESVSFYRKRINKIPINFNIVRGDFDCGANNLEYLNTNIPERVGANFFCDKNQLKELNNIPKYVRGSFQCHQNNIERIDDLSNYIGQEINYDNNNIRTLDNFSSKISIKNNPIEVIWELFENYNYIDYFNELDIIQDDGKVVILERLNYFLTDIGKEEVTKDDIKNYKVI